MGWRLLYSDEAARQLRSMDRHDSLRVVKYMEERVVKLDDPRRLGRALKGSKWEDCWRYRCGDYRIIVRIMDEDVVVVVLKVSNRKDVY